MAGTQTPGELLAEHWPELVPDEFVAWDPEGTEAWEYRRKMGAEVVDLLRAHGFEIVRAENRCPACGTGQVEATTLGERDPRYVPACTCDQEPYQ